MEKNTLIRAGYIIGKINFWLVLSLFSLFAVALYSRIITMIQLDLVGHLILMFLFIAGVLISGLITQVGALSISKLLVLYGEKTSIEKPAKLNIKTKDLDFRETNQEKVILLMFANKELWHDADDMVIRFTDICQTEGDETNAIKSLRHQVFNDKYKLAWSKTADQKSISVKLARKETKELFFVETNRARNEFYVKVDPRGQRNNSDTVGGFPPGKYEIDLMVRGNMPKRVIFWSLRVSVFYNGGNQLYVNIESVS